MAEGTCASCGRSGGRGDYRPVPMWLRIAAFPMIAIIFIKRLGDWQLVDEYCESCRPKQIFCYVIVGIWSVSFVGYLLWEVLQGKNPFAD